MKIKYLSTLLFGLFASLTVSAQQQKEFTLEDLNFGGKNFHNMVGRPACASGRIRVLSGRQVDRQGDKAVLGKRNQPMDFKHQGHKGTLAL